MPTMPERMATQEANFASLVQRLDRQVQADAIVHKDLTNTIKQIVENERTREKFNQRLIGAGFVVVAIANIVGPLIVRYVERTLLQ